MEFVAINKNICYHQACPLTPSGLTVRWIFVEPKHVTLTLGDRTVQLNCSIKFCQSGNKNNNNFTWSKKEKSILKKICSFPSLKYRVRIGLSPQRSVYGPGCIFIWIIMKRFSSVDLNLKQLNFSLFLTESILLKIWWIVMWHHLWSQKHACTPVFNITGFDFIVNFQLLNQWWEDGNLWVGLLAANHG